MMCICVLWLEISAPAADIQSPLLQDPALPTALSSLRLLLLWFLSMATSWSAKHLSRLTHVLQPIRTAATHGVLAHRIASLTISSHRHKLAQRRRNLRPNVAVYDDG